jgi:hypothetical protein
MKILTSIQKYFFPALALCLGLTAQAQTVIHTEDFETDGQDAGSGLTASGQQARYTATTPFSSTANDHWNRTDGSGLQNGTGAYSSFSGTYFWAAEDTDTGGSTGGTGNDEQTLDITGIDITGATALQFQGLFGANSRPAGGSNYDSTDWIKVQAQIDGGGYSDVIWFAYLDGGDSASEPLGVDRDFNRKADSSTDLLGPALQSYSADISGTGSTLDIKITVHMDGPDEEIAFDNLQILGTVSGNEAITLSATPTTVDEGSTLAVTLSVPTNVDTDTVFNLTSGGDGTELSIPGTATITTGTSSVSFNVSGLSDGVYDGNQDVTITAELTGYISDTLDITVVDADSAPTAPPLGDIIFTQYYEDTGNYKWLEITNISDSPVDLSSYQATLWSNANTEAWKTSGGTPDRTLSFSGVTLAAGEVYVIGNPYVPTTHYSYTLSDVKSEITFFGGDDSLVLYSDPTGYSIDNILDAISFTAAGDEGADKGFIRTSASIGYNLANGSSIEDYDGDNTEPAVWTEITITATDAAVLGDDAYPGNSSLVAAPTYILFTAATQSVAEADASFDIGVQATGLTSGTVTVQVDYNSSNSTADLTDISYPTAQQLTFDAASLVSPQTITIPIVDDGLDGSTEIASFDLSIISGTATLATPSTQNVSISDDDFVIPAVFISEIVDPQVEWRDGRYVELYNASASPVDLSAGNWNLVYYGNANATGTNIALTGTIQAGGTYIIAQDAANFSSVYTSVTQDQGNSAVNSNGDDNFELRFGGGQSTGQLVDIYGQPGTAAGAWDFENGRAVRNASITSGNITWTASEWTIESTSVSAGNMTPGVHPDPSVGEPTGVTASAVSDTEISVAFAAISSNDVIIVSDADGTFTAPSGDAPTVGDSFAGGTVVYVGQVSPFAHTGLTASTQYYYSVFSVNGTDYSSTVEVNATTQVAGLINSEDFNDTAGDADDWFNQTVSGDDPWNLNDTYNVIVIDGGLTAGTIDDHYLISPEFDLSSTEGVTITFDYAGSYDANTSLENLQLVYSTGYTGDASTTTWLPLTFNFTNITTDQADVTIPGDLVSSGQVDISAVDSQSAVRLAFRYISPDGTIETSEQWVINNIFVQGTPATDPLATYLTARSLTSSDLATDTTGNGFTVLEEYLAGFGDGSGPDAISYGIDNDALTLTSDLESEPSGITVVLQATSDLSVAFANVAFTASVGDVNADGSYTRSYTETDPPAGGQRFLRLSITTD